MKCIVCEREFGSSAFRGKAVTCRLCAAGRRRLARLMVNRSWWRALDSRARQCLLHWEIGRLAFTRALLTRGVVIEWYGLKPVVVKRREDAL